MQSDMKHSCIKIMNKVELLKIVRLSVINVNKCFCHTLEGKISHLPYLTV